MRCLNCQTDNPPGAYTCMRCNSALSAGPTMYQQGQQGYPQYPPQGQYPSQYQQQPPKKKSTGMVIAIVIIVVCVVGAVVIGMPLLLYVWVTSLADTSSTSTTALGITAQDAAATADQASGTDATGFEVGEDFIRIDHITGGDIDWSTLNTLRATIVGSDTSVTLTVLKIGPTAYSTSNSDSSPGDVIILGIMNSSDNNKIHAGDSVRVSIYGPGQQWASPYSGFVVD
jgi:hypothetical protein